MAEKDNEKLSPEECATKLQDPLAKMRALIEDHKRRGTIIETVPFDREALDRHFRKNLLPELREIDRWQRRSLRKAFREIRVGGCCYWLD